jgi:hypothetical protein
MSGAPRSPHSIRAWIRGLAIVAALALAPCAPAHTGERVSVHDTVNGIVERLKATLDARKIDALSRGRVEGLLTRAEKRALATSHITFHVSAPVRVTVFHDKSLKGDPYWLRDRAWRKASGVAKVGDTEFEPFQRDFPAGEVALGVNSLGGGGRHYFVTVVPRDTDTVEISEIFPAQLELANLVTSAPPWVDREDKLTAVPDEFAGQTLLRTLHARRDDARVSGRIRWTDFPSSPKPDHIVLTWAGDPRTTQAIQWRTSPATLTGAVLYTEEANASAPLSEWKRVEALTTVISSVTTANDPVVHRHTARLEGLQPGTTYRYCVGDGSGSGWTPPRAFKTAPPGPAPFSFVYMGDAQAGLDTWGRMLRGAFDARPDVAFYLMAGDMVDRGSQRDDWDRFFENAAPVFNRRPLVPVIGNHECQGGRPALYLEHFALPTNGPVEIEAERAYSFHYGNALFVILDSNLPPESQAAWLDATLAASSARWKIVSCHHPTYSSAPNRDNKKMRETWSPIFERHGVDLALQGHDHAYLRTHPIRGGQRVANPADGITYIVSVSGTKLYRQAERPETAVGFTDVPTWQVLDLKVGDDRLTYKAYDAAGKVCDEFVIQK